MVNGELPHGLHADVAPPAKHRRTLDTKEWLWLASGLLWVCLLVFWDIAVVLYNYILPPPDKSLKGKVVLVTGAGRGLGRGLAEGFARQGCKVAVVDINLSTATSSAEEIAGDGAVAKPYQCDVASPAAVRALRLAVTADLGPVDVLVNNAGIIYGGDLLEDCQEQDIRRVVEVNLLSHFWMVKEFLPVMKDRNSGYIVAIASETSFVAGTTGSAYIASNPKCTGLMEVVRMELALNPNNNVHTTTVYPYFINTSADYVARFKIRIPPLSIEETVAATIAGVKKNSASVYVPASYQLALLLINLLPVRSFMRFKDLIFFGMLPQRKPAENTSS